ncbi:hypothetical protein J3U21_04270 [Gilliamella sp. B2776]|uniref:hypothetical protein n=1 Tax=unclassified Gilliamella TaxID=2685620 RepID=UPI00226AF573|nr:MULTISPECIES: hypothetical protein [unclassified Gilliamella]MCX8656955.1 hypothetical protein [Gilliamella sp. B2894]MCX8649651.1 hypothetical protein [Gilliamella sp. B2779]MCX8654831.1 hypothetical protein [Gilliamella sp. B2737]MCX8665037.1 hypothetical protein [Gilliamella sp. B2887]MCX8691359.1 hypothetical protein [Gilliamella sp. B2776]
MNFIHDTINQYPVYLNKITVYNQLINTILLAFIEANVYLSQFSSKKGGSYGLHKTWHV